jgi:arylsulfatase A-like enzyme
LIIKAPGLMPERLSGPVGLVDLAPTLLDLAGFVPPGMPQMDGVSLVPYLTGDRSLDDDEGEAYSVMVQDRSVPEDLFALVAGRYKLITDGGEEHELYDIVSDSREKKNIAKDKPNLLRRLQLRLAARRKVDRIAPF